MSSVAGFRGRIMGAMTKELESSFKVRERHGLVEGGFLAVGVGNAGIPSGDLAGRIGVGKDGVSRFPLQIPSPRKRLFHQRPGRGTEGYEDPGRLSV